MNLEETSLATRNTIQPTSSSFDARKINKNRFMSKQLKLVELAKVTSSRSLEDSLRILEEEDPLLLIANRNLGKLQDALMELSKTYATYELLENTHAAQRLIKWKKRWDQLSTYDKHSDASVQSQQQQLLKLAKSILQQWRSQVTNELEKSRKMKEESKWTSYTTSRTRSQAFKAITTRLLKQDKQDSSFDDEFYYYCGEIIERCVFASNHIKVPVEENGELIYHKSKPSKNYTPTVRMLAILIEKSTPLLSEWSQGLQTSWVPNSPRIPNEDQITFIQQLTSNTTT